MWHKRGFNKIHVPLKAQRLWSGCQAHHLYTVHPYCSWGGWITLRSFPCTSDQGKGIKKLKLWLQKELLLRYLKLAGKRPEFLLTSSQQELTRRWQVHGVGGAVQPLWGQSVQIYRWSQSWAGHCQVQGLWMKEDRGECNDSSSPGPAFVRGNKKITSENKYYLVYWLKKGKLMPRHHA